MFLALVYGDISFSPWQGVASRDSCHYLAVCAKPLPYQGVRASINIILVVILLILQGDEGVVGKRGIHDVSAGGRGVFSLFVMIFVLFVASASTEIHERTRRE